MDLNELLADIDGIGGDSFVPSKREEPIVEEAPEAIASTRSEEEITPEPVVAEASDQMPGLNMVLDVELELTVELGQTRLPLQELAAIQPGDKIALTQHPDDHLKIFVNDRLIALGEPLVVDGALAVKIVELISTDSPQQ